MNPSAEIINHIRYLLDKPNGIFKVGAFLTPEDRDPPCPWEDIEEIYIPYIKDNFLSYNPKESEVLISIYKNYLQYPPSRRLFYNLIGGTLNLSDPLCICVMSCEELRPLLLNHEINGTIRLENGAVGLYQNTLKLLKEAKIPIKKLSIHTDVTLMGIYGRLLLGIISDNLGKVTEKIDIYIPALDLSRNQGAGSEPPEITFGGFGRTLWEIVNDSGCKEANFIFCDSMKESSFPDHLAKWFSKTASPSYKVYFSRCYDSHNQILNITLKS